MAHDPPVVEQELPPRVLFQDGYELPGELLVDDDGQLTNPGVTEAAPERRCRVDGVVDVLGSQVDPA